MTKEANPLQQSCGGRAPGQKQKLEVVRDNENRIHQVQLRTPVGELRPNRKAQINIWISF